jgi:hypothetical protein
MGFSREGADISHGEHAVSAEVLTDFTHRCLAQSNLSL